MSTTGEVGQTGPTTITPEPPPAPAFAPPGEVGGRRRRRRWPWIVAGVTVAVAGVAAVLVTLVLMPTPLTFEGRDIAQPEAVLRNGERFVAVVVLRRNGATNEHTRCYFSLPDDERSDVSDHLLCGPVLFVDGDPDATYLALPLTVAGEATRSAELKVSGPGDEDPIAPDGDVRLRRPDGLEAPEGAGGLEAPLPRRTEAGLLLVHDLDGVELNETGSDAIIVSFSRSLRLTGLATPDRFGRGDDARRAAEGERLVAVELAITPGHEGVAPDLPVVNIQVGDEAPKAVPEEVRNKIGTIGMIVGVPEGAERVDLIVSEVGVEQRLSLLTGDPAAQNPSVLRRDNRSQTLSASQPLTFTSSAPGFVTETFTITSTIHGVDLHWFYGGGTIHPADPARAYLVVTHELQWPTPFRPDTALEEPFWTLTLSDGTSIPAVNVDPDRPTWVTIAFEVPADFTTGTITVGGRHTFPDTNDTWDFGSNRLDVPVAIPAG